MEEATAETSHSESEVTELESEEDDPNIPSILESISQEQIDNFQPFHIRYFQEKYCTKFTTEDVNLDTCIRVHTNKLCVVFLSPKHSVITKNQKISNLNFKISNKVDRLKNVMSGKGKKGAQILQPNSVLCFIVTEAGDQYPVYAGICGKLLEINDRLVETPSLIVEDLNEGFLAIILPELRKHEENLKSLKSKEEYFT